MTIATVPLSKTAGSEVELYCEAGADHAHIDQPGRDDALRTIERMARWLRG